MLREIVLREYIERKPTLEDRANNVGLDEMLKKLRDNEWIDASEEVIALKHFELTYQGVIDPKNKEHYIEWKATLYPNLN